MNEEKVNEIVKAIMATGAINAPERLVRDAVVKSLDFPDPAVRLTWEWPDKPAAKPSKTHSLTFPADGVLRKVIMDHRRALMALKREHLNETRKRQEELDAANENRDWSAAENLPNLDPDETTDDYWSDDELPAGWKESERRYRRKKQVSGDGSIFDDDLSLPPMDSRKNKRKRKWIQK